MDDLAKLTVSVARVEEKVGALTDKLDTFMATNCARHLRWTEEQQAKIDQLQEARHNAIGGWKALLGAGAVGGFVGWLANIFKH